MSVGPAVSVAEGAQLDLGETNEEPTAHGAHEVLPSEYKLPELQEMHPDKDVAPTFELVPAGQGEQALGTPTVYVPAGA